MKKVFISYKHSDRSYVDQVKSVADNPNNSLEFYDHSLPEPVLNEYGHVNRRTPSDPGSEPVKKKIEELLKQADKLLVIIGTDTHSSEWVKWEMDTFARFKGEKNILMIRHQNSTGGTPSGCSSYRFINWNTNELNRWIKY